MRGVDSEKRRPIDVSCAMSPQTGHLEYHQGDNEYGREWKAAGWKGPCGGDVSDARSRLGLGGRPECEPVRPRCDGPYRDRRWSRSLGLHSRASAECAGSEPAQLRRSRRRNDLGPLPRVRACHCRVGTSPLFDRVLSWRGGATQPGAGLEGQAFPTGARWRKIGGEH